MSREHAGLSARLARLMGRLLSPMEQAQTRTGVTPREEPGRLIQALYRKLLLRDPDEAGFTSHLRHWSGSDFDPADIIQAFLQSAEFQARSHIFFREYVGKGKLIHDHSQNGEVDYLIQSMINDSAKRRYVVDVGARGRERSNSYDFLKFFGWKGLLVEANPNLVESINSDFSGLDFQLLSCAVADYEGEAEFYFGVNDDVSSLHEQGSAAWGPLQGRCRVQVRRLPGLLAEAKAPEDFDLLSLLIHRSDFPVINDLIANSPYRPARVIVEVYESNKVKSLEQLPLHPQVKQEYELVGDVGANIVLRHVSRRPTSVR